MTTVHTVLRCYQNECLEDERREKYSSRLRSNTHCVPALYFDHEMATPQQCQSGTSSRIYTLTRIHIAAMHGADPHALKARSEKGGDSSICPSCNASSERHWALLSHASMLCNSEILACVPFAPARLARVSLDRSNVIEEHIAFSSVL